MNDKIPTQSGTRDQLMREFTSVIKDAETWLSSSLTGDDLKAIKEKFELTLANAKDGVLRCQDAVVEKTKESAKAADDYVHENPWRSIAIGAGIGLLLGAIVSRR